MKKITAQTTLAEVLKKKGAAEILSKHHLPCLSCALAQFEMDKLTLGEICQIYQLDLEALLKDLNQL